MVEKQRPSKRGRPITREIKLDATPEQVARAIFADAKSPDPRKRKGKSGGKSRA